MDWMLLPYRRYADFSGRSRRKEFWMFTLFYCLVLVAFFAMFIAGLGTEGAGDQSEPSTLSSVAMLCAFLFVIGSFIPHIAVTVRRFHDQDKTGWLWLLSFVPFGGLIMLYFMVQPGTPGDNTYGADPKDPHGLETFR